MCLDCAVIPKGRRHGCGRTAEEPESAPLDAEIERLSLGERGRKALLAVAEKRTGARFDLALGCPDELEDPAGRIGQFLLTHLIYVGQEDVTEAGRIFEEIAVNPVKEAFFRHLLGDVHRMSTSNGWVKFRTPERH